jgi:hypothetical protein
MTHKIEIIESRPEHVHLLGLLMNSEERAEAEAMGFDPHKLLWRTYRNSLIRKTVFVDGKIAAMFGCAGIMMGLVGQPYLITSSAAREVSPIVFSRIYRKEVREMLKLFPSLENLVDSRYTRSVKMLRFAGFAIEEPKKLFSMEVLFHKYSLTELLLS